MGMNTMNKQDAIRAELAKELIVQNLREEYRLRPIKEYAEQFGVGLGTVQAALNDLKVSGAVELNACGAQGTFLARVDQKALWKMSGYGILVGLLPLDTGRSIKGLATGIYEGFTRYDLPIHILFARGSANRTEILTRGKSDFVVMSEMAYQYALELGKPLMKVGEIGRRGCSYGILTRKGAPAETFRQIAYDNYSYEQRALVRACWPEEQTCGRYLGVQLADLVRTGQVEAALVNHEAEREDGQAFELHPLNGLDPEMKAQMDRAVIVVSTENRALMDLLAIVASKEIVTPVQEAVIRGEQFVRY